MGYIDHCRYSVVGDNGWSEVRQDDQAADDSDVKGDKWTMMASMDDDEEEVLLLSIMIRMPMMVIVTVRLSIEMLMKMMMMTMIYMEVVLMMRMRKIMEMTRQKCLSSYYVQASNRKQQMGTFLFFSSLNSLQLL